MDSKELPIRFSFHPATPDTVDKHDAIRQLCFDLADHIDELTPAGREQSLAITALEECMMWANAAIARRS